MHLCKMLFQMVVSGEAVRANAATPFVGTVFIRWIMNTFHVTVKVRGPGEFATFGGGGTARKEAGKRFVGLLGTLRFGASTSRRMSVSGNRVFNIRGVWILLVMHLMGCYSSGYWT